MQQNTATTSVPINELIAKRWSPRAFNPTMPVSHDDLRALLEAARWAASCYNDQPWRFIVCDKTADEAAWRRALEVIVEKNQLWAKHAPVLMLAVAMNDFNHNGQPNRWAAYDTGAASANLSLQATALGLIVHQMGGFNAEKARNTFKLPDNCQPMAMMAVGHQAEADSLGDDFKAMEVAGRPRAELKERFYVGSWGVGVD
jgi:nitroreductase